MLQGRWRASRRRGPGRRTRTGRWAPRGKGGGGRGEGQREGGGRLAAGGRSDEHERADGLGGKWREREILPFRGAQPEIVPMSGETDRAPGGVVGPAVVAALERPGAARSRENSRAPVRADVFEGPKRLPEAADDDAPPPHIRGKVVPVVREIARQPDAEPRRVKDIPALELVPGGGMVRGGFQTSPDGVSHGTPSGSTRGGARRSTRDRRGSRAARRTEPPRAAGGRAPPSR